MLPCTALLLPGRDKAMCCFTRPVFSIADTRSFARLRSKK